MPDERPQPLFPLKHRGVFNLSRLLNGIKGWYGENEYEFHEPKHKYKVPSAAGAEYEIEFFGVKNFDKYARFKIKVEVKAYDVKDIEIVKEGEKMKMNEGSARVEVSGVLILDWQGKFEKNRFFKALRDFYHKFIIKKTIEDFYEDKFIMELIGMVNTVKKELGHEVL